MDKWYDRWTLPIHLAVIFIGFVAFVALLMTGDARWLLLSAFAWWFTVKTS
jgi:hypothetical protein